MAYRIGQIRYNNNKNYYDALNYTQQNYTQQNLIASSAKIFTDYGIALSGSDSNFLNDANYYVNFSVKMKNTPQTIFLKLKTPSGTSEERQQLIKTFYINQIKPQTEYPYINCEAIISPKENYPQLVWELQRGESVDYTTDQTELWFEDEVTPPQRNGRVIQFEEKPKIFKINILDDVTYPLKKIGIQARPSFLMCINKQEIRIGRSGIFEVNNGVEITSIGFVPKGADDYFIMDYEY